MAIEKKKKGENGDDGPGEYLLYERGTGRVKIYTFGAHITSFKVGGVERTWMSSLSTMDGSGPMRGGVPIAFPQFADEGPLKLHGFARESIWTVKDATEEEGIVMELKDNQTTREIWDFPFTLTYTVKLGEKGDELNLELKVVNEGEAEFTFGGCLHTYFGCEALSVNVSGLGGMDYIDKCDSRKVKKQENESFTVPMESHRSAEDSGKAPELGFVDRVYLNVNVPGSYTISDASGSPIYSISHTGFPDTTVYNPFTGDKQGPGFPDFDDDGYLKIICIEPTIGQDNRVKLGGGEQWVGGQRIKVVSK